MENLNNEIAFLILDANNNENALRWNASGNLYIFNSIEEAVKKGSSITTPYIIKNINECSEELQKEYLLQLDKEL